MRLGRDGLAGAIGLCFSVLLIWQSFALPSLPLVPVGPGFYPRIVLVLLGLACLVLLVQDVAATRLATGEAASDAAASQPDYGRVALGFAVVTAYIVLLPYLGFRIATGLFVPAMQLAIERPRTLLQWLLPVVLGVVTAAVTWLVFERYLAVLLPRGLWTGW